MKQLLPECPATHEKEAQVDDSKTQDEADCGDDGQQIPEANPSAAVRPVHGIKWLLVVLATLISVFLYALDNTVVADIVPAIVNDFNSVSELSWLSVGFALGGIALTMPFGKLFGLFDGKWLYIGCVVLFMSASALCGAAPNMDAEIVGRVLAGAGGNGMYLGVLTLLSVNTSGKERPIYLSLAGVFFGIGTVLGPIVGGGFEKFTWRWSFYIIVILSGVFTPIMVLYIPRFDPGKGTPAVSRLKRIDWIGLFFSVAGLTCWVTAINFGGTIFLWSSGAIVALFVVGGAAWIIFFLQQVFKIGTSEVDRLFPLHLVFNKEPVLLFLATAGGAAACFIPVNYIPIYFIFTRGDSGVEAAVRLLPYIFILSSTILINGALLGKLGYYKPWYLAGTPLLLAGGILISLIHVSTSTSAIYGYEVLFGLGAGAFAQSGFAIIQGVVPPEDMSNGITFTLIGQLSGITFGLAIAGAVFLNEAANSLAVILPNTSRNQLQQLIAGTSSTLLDGLDDSVRADVLNAIVSALRKVFIPVYVGAGVALICGLLMKNKKMHGGAVPM